MSSKLKIPERIREHFRFSTLSFIFIIAYVNIFPRIFGPENSITAVIFTILMSASMVRDLTATPIRHLFIQSFTLVWMAFAAYLVTALPALPSFFINFITLLLILYAFTYEYSTHMYFPYILSYLFLIFISPVNADQLPGRLIGMLAGAVSILLYQWVMGRKRAAKTARDVLSEMIDIVSSFLSAKLSGTDAGSESDFASIHHKLCSLSRIVYQRRKKALCVSEAGFSIVDTGRGLEHLMYLSRELPRELTIQEKELLGRVSQELDAFRLFLHQDIAVLPVPDSGILSSCDRKLSLPFYHILIYIRDRMLHMTDPHNKTHFHPTVQSLKIRLQAAMDLSPVRAAYAIRVALLLSFAALLVQSLALPHGKWLLFTIASVSLPYADDVPGKMKKRIIATVAGGLISVAVYSLIPSPAGRTAAMMLSGYLSFYFTDYAEVFTCSTVGAMGGAVFMSAFGFRAVSGVFLIRLGYILAGAVIAYAANCLILPFNRAKATRQLWKKYKAFTDLLTNLCHSASVDSQLYYNLVIQAHMQEEKLVQNASLEQWEDFPRLLKQCRSQVRNAHRSLIAERIDAPVFESEHLL
ncbi:MAG: FUSC family protein [Clostridium sp.]|nr:FUSC family protein [Clostridium sp.]